MSMQAKYFWILLLASLFITAGAMAEPVELKDIWGGRHQSKDFFARDTKAVVFISMSVPCPLLNGYYLGPLMALEKKYRDKGVQFVGIYANAGENLWSIAEHALDRNLTFPVFLDEGGAFAKKLGLTRITEVAVVNPKEEILYRGAIDNFNSEISKVAKKAESDREHYLDDALAQLKPMETRPAVGCLINFQNKKPATEVVTYKPRIEAILHKNCISCHRENGGAPFSLVTYDDAFANSQMIAEVVKDRRMPPWSGTMGDKKFGLIKHDRRLSLEDIRLVRAWVDSGAGRGEGEDPPLPAWLEPGQWQIGKPDLIVELPEPEKVPPFGNIVYKYRRIQMNFPEDRWIKAIESQPGDPSVVHHIQSFFVEAGEGDPEGLLGMLEIYGTSSMRSGHLHHYLPGDPFNAKTFAPNEGMLLPKGKDLIMEMHYTSSGKETLDQSKIGFIFRDSPPEVVLETAVFVKKRGRFAIPAKDPNFQMTDEYYFENDVKLFSVKPHFHFRGKNYKLEIEYADGKRETIFKVPVWNFNWQITYEFEKPIVVPSTATLVATVSFDNSRFNPNNPNPAKEVRWGVQSEDEMFNTRFTYVNVKEGETK